MILVSEELKPLHARDEPEPDSWHAIGFQKYTCMSRCCRFLKIPGSGKSHAPFYNTTIAKLSMVMNREFHILLLTQ
jgi:hypothetical protein